MGRWIGVIVLVLAGVAIPFGLAVGAAFLSITPMGRTFMIVENTPGAPVEGTVLVQYQPGSWARGGRWFAWIGVLRTDLMLDPGPYTADERRRWQGNITWPRVPGSTNEASAPSWVRAVALQHAGPKLAGWQARAAAFGWPRPVLYWLWDWRTESLQGGVVATMADPKMTLPGAKAQTGITGWNTRPKSVPEYALPWRIVWSGLVVDVGMWWGAIGTVYLTWRGVRRWKRGRQGKCLRCGYDRVGLAASAACPECGGMGRG